MANLRIQLGAEADIATTGELTDSVNDLKKHIDKRSRGDFKPIRRKLSASTFDHLTLGTHNYTTIGGANLTPAVGRVWVVRSIHVYDAGNLVIAEEQSTVLGCICVGNYDSPSAPDVSGFISPGLPAAMTFNTSSIIVNAGEDLYYLIQTNDIANLGFNVEVDDWDQTVYQAQRI